MRRKDLVTKRQKTKKRKKQYLEALKKSMGNVSVASRDAGINRCTPYAWCDSDPKFAQAVKDLKEERHDFVESQLMKNIREGREASIIYYLKCLCKSRGWIEKSQLEHRGDVGVYKTTKAEDLSDEELTRIIRRGLITSDTKTSKPNKKLQKGIKD